MTIVGFCLRMRFGETAEIAVFHNNAGAGVHAFQVGRKTVTVGEGPGKRIFLPADAVFVGTGAGAETGVGIGRHREKTKDADIGREEGIQLVGELLTGKGCQRLLAVKVGVKARSMHPGVGASATGEFGTGAQDHAEGFRNKLLYTQRIGLVLPTVVGGAVISQLNKVAMHTNYKFTFFFRLFEIPIFVDY